MRELERLLGRVARATRRSFVRDERGSVPTEYVILMGTVGLIVAGALVAIGPQIIAGYQHARDTLASPLP